MVVEDDILTVKYLVLATLLNLGVVVLGKLEMGFSKPISAAIFFFLVDFGRGSKLDDMGVII